ncbi:MAG: hypothetical protein UX04_C0003G0032 [Microgenomates group bacterium GW2011_GWF2_45_18]|nr:MAG: hypothetical protein UW18_C0002G0032 [Microgenomates group bacterium GW2011_GWF1_44_10]KKU01760.1 MAG: hypothetical protein UX04_C0003G0032 [Microgenomates group bacterium GW2011_GWF2_45_18]OGJ41583.1 MAG: hypothetical protein A2378_03065 [Candidatus Pacebacteria bacterium RIFOXYB1_FULL_44_10]HAU98936.1 hypothetical protein [Candidatus Paceibacterota bacterium]HAX01107.1 hypothetical protein [Candidatus Paceibacterota bacterium]
MPILPSSSAKTTSALRANNFRDRRYLLFSVLAWVVMGLLVWKVMLPRFELFRSYQSELKKQQSDLSTLQSRIAFLDQFNTEEYQQLRAQIHSLLPSSKPFLISMYSLQKLADQTGVRFVGISVSPGLVSTDEASLNTQKRREEVSKLALEITLMGTAEQVQTYIGEMQKIAPVFDLEKIELGSGKSSKTSIGKTIEGVNTEKESSESGKVFLSKLTVSAFYMDTIPELTGDTLPILRAELNDFAKTLRSVKEIVNMNEILQALEASQSAGKENPFER